MANNIYEVTVVYTFLDKTDGAAKPIKLRVSAYDTLEASEKALRLAKRKVVGYDSTASKCSVSIQVEKILDMVYTD